MRQQAKRGFDGRPGRLVGRGRSPGTRTSTSGSSAAAVQAMQRSAGNRATAALLGTLPSATGPSPSSPGVVVQRKGGKKRAEELVEFLKRSPIAEKTDEEVQAGLDLWLSGRAGNVHRVDVTKSGLQAAAETSGGIGLGAYGRGAISADESQYPFGMTVQQYQALVELGAYIGVEGKASSQVFVKAGPVAARLMSSVKAFAGALARARAQGKVTFIDGFPYPVGFTGSASAEAFAGAKSSGTSELTLGFTPATLAGLGVGAEIGFGAMAGAEAKAEGKIAIDILHGQIATSGKASAFAGAKIEGTAGGSARLYGRKAFSITTKATASAGAGGEAEGGFELIGGKLTIKLKGMGALGAGFGGGFELENDFKPFAVFIWRQAAKAQWKLASKHSSREVNDKLTNYQSCFDSDVRPKLEQYRDLKLNQLRMNAATNYAKLEKIQAIIDWSWPRFVLTKKHDVGGIDAALTKLLKDVFEDFKDAKAIGVRIDVEVKKGKIRSFQTSPPDLHVLLGGGVEGRHAHGTNAAKTNLMSDVGK